MRILIAMLVALPMLFAGVSARAQLYKWVDESGVVTYSNQLPVNPGAAKKVEVVADRVSVYTPDPALKGAIEAERQGRGVSARMEEQDRRFYGNSQQGAPVAALPPSGGPCAIWPSDCLSQWESYYYPPVYFAAAPHFHGRHRPHVTPHGVKNADFSGRHVPRSGMGTAMHGSRPFRSAQLDRPR